jgi:predicted enzyme related to lactoylglutathione lyase
MKPVVHLELHTGSMERARAFYAELFGWKEERIDTGPRSYLALELGRGLGGGIVECATDRALWLPYVEVAEIRAATDAARASGASILLEPREGPTGWRSVVATPAAGEIALWQPKR